MKSASSKQVHTDEERYGLGLELLRSSSGQQGWDLYDLHPSEPVDRVPDRFKNWDGRFDTRLLLHAEQGLGDCLQMLGQIVRLESVLARHITVSIHDDLTCVVPTRLGRHIKVISKSDVATLPEEDFHASRMMSLFSRHALHAPIEPAVPFLKLAFHEPYLPPRTGEDSRPLRVGIAWQSTQRRNMPDRSIDPAFLVRAASNLPVELISLHRPMDVSFRHRRVTQPAINNLRDTAAIASECDAVVSVDTVTAHLGPAVGVRSVVILPIEPDWRWGQKDRPTHWYTHLTAIFREADITWSQQLRNLLTSPTLHTPAP